MKFSNSLFICAVLGLSGCGASHDFSDLQAYMDEVRARPKGSIEPLPKFQPYESFTYSAASMRNPFQPPIKIDMTKREKGSKDIKPDESRTKQFLEDFNIEVFQMVGTLANDGGVFALVSGAGGVHRVKVGGWNGRAASPLRSALNKSGVNMKKNNRSAQRNLIMNSSLSRLGLSLLAGLLSPSLLAADLQKLDVAALPGDKVELKLTFDEPVLAPRGYTIEQPARIALDLPGVSNKLGAKSRELGVGNARSVTVVEAKDRTRLIINLTNLAPYNTRVEGNHLYVVVGEGARTATAAVQSTPVAAAAPAKVYVPQGRAISNIDFQRGDQGEGNVVITLSDASVSPDIQDQGGKIRLDFAKTQLPESLRVRLDVKDFATPVQFVSATGSSDKASILIEPVGVITI